MSLNAVPVMVSLPSPPQDRLARVGPGAVDRVISGGSGHRGVGLSQARSHDAVGGGVSGKGAAEHQPEGEYHGADETSPLAAFAPMFDAVPEVSPGQTP